MKRMLKDVSKLIQTSADRVESKLDREVMEIQGILARVNDKLDHVETFEVID